LLHITKLHFKTGNNSPLASSTFEKTRIGLCVLHPDHCAGSRCVVTHGDGGRTEGIFPTAIAPHQPFLDIRKITHEVKQRIQAEVELEGETFEMEDQRNWTDASYKIYGTPLKQPYPVRIESGTRIFQRVILKIKDMRSIHISRRGSSSGKMRVRIDWNGPPIKIPQIGSRVSSHTAQSLTSPIADQISAMRLTHLRFDFGRLEKTSSSPLRQHFRSFEQLGLPLEFGVSIAGADIRPLSIFLESVKSELSKLKISRWFIYAEDGGPADSTSLREIFASLKRLNLSGVVGTGSIRNFAEINRSHPPIDDLNVVSYALNPQTHATDDQSLMETLPIQGLTVSNARRFTGRCILAVSPITLLPESGFELSRDDRQSTLFNAAWTLGSIKYLAEAGADILTYFDVVGDGGLMPDDSKQEPTTALEGQSEKRVFPVYHILASVCDFQPNGYIIKSRTSQPLTVLSLVLSTGRRRRILIANLKAIETGVRLGAGPYPREARLRELAPNNVAWATESPHRFRTEPSATRTISMDSENVLHLQPYSVLQIDFLF